MLVQRAHCHCFIGFFFAVGGMEADDSDTVFASTLGIFQNAGLLACGRKAAIRRATEVRMGIAPDASGSDGLLASASDSELTSFTEWYKLLHIEDIQRLPQELRNVARGLVRKRGHNVHREPRGKCTRVAREIDLGSEHGSEHGDSRDESAWPPWSEAREQLSSCES